jgi:DNA-binding NtrC family response regulator
MGGHTLSVSRDEISNRTQGYLFCVLSAEDPFAPSSRHSLANVESVEITRGEARRVARRGEVLSFKIPDSRLSQPHAALRRTASGWAVEDLGSRNGVMRNGRPVQRAALEDGDVLGLGYTFFVYRVGGPMKDAAEDVDAASLEGVPPGLRSLSPGLADTFARLPRAARSGLAVMVRGENGTGKELVARAVHELSGRPGRLVAVNCGALTSTLYAAELLGYRKGAFTGATQDKAGLLAASHRGTLFLDELADLAPEAQAALLRALQEQEVMPIGATEPTPLDLRFVSATHGDLEAAVEAGKMRFDLLQRVRGFDVRLPPLRERREDLGLLVAELLRRAAPDDWRRLRLTGRAARELFARAWRGNVRELERSLMAAVVMAEGDAVKLPPEGAPAPENEPAREGGGEAEARPSRRPLRLDPEDIERIARLEALLREHEGNVASVAREMGKEREQVYRWARRYRIDVERFRLPTEAEPPGPRKPRE